MQTIAAQSTTEAKYIAMSLAVCEALSKSVIHDLNSNLISELTTVKIITDNQ